MATFNKFQSFVGDVGTKVLNLNSDNLYILLTNTAPNAADNVVDTTTTTCTVKSTSNAAEISAGNGYVKKGAQIASNAYSQSAGTGSLTGNAVKYTASGGTIGAFRYAVIFDDTSGTTSTRSVIGWWDLGSTTLNDGQAFTIGKDTSGGNWDSGTPILTIA
jgi:hypothetical protein